MDLTPLIRSQKRANSSRFSTQTPRPSVIVDKADVSEYDFSQFKPMRFEFEKKTEQINLRMPESLVDALKARANKQRNIPYQRLIREAIENALR